MYIDTMTSDIMGEFAIVILSQLFISDHFIVYREF